MPHVIVAALAGLGVYAGARLLKRALQHLDTALEQARAAAQSSAEPELVEKDLGALVWDDAAHVYRPQHRN